MVVSKESLDQLTWRLSRLRAPKVFIFAVLLAAWTTVPDLDTEDKFQCVEFFAGKAMLSKTQLWSGKRSVRLDIAYLKPTKGKNGKKHPMDITTPEGMSLAIIAILHGDPAGFLCHFGIKCSSWTTINSGTSARTACCSIGNTDYPSVLEANLMASRVALLALLVVAMNGCFTLEQPFNSVLEFYPRWQWLIQQIRNMKGDVFKASWYMLHYGAPTPKRHWAYSNSAHILKLWRGRLVGWKKRPKEEREKNKTTTTYKDKNGKTRYKGNSNLKRSEEYPVRFGMKLVELFPDLVSDKRGLPMLPVPVPSATEVFGGMDFGLDAEALWAEGSLVEVCRYLRGGKSLDIPEEFRPLLPKRL